MITNIHDFTDEALCGLSYFIAICIRSYWTSFTTDVYTYLCVSRTLINGKWKTM